ncbi:unnamed protein product [Chrysodeixis includens]|uniref:C2H2-type domain-containing protein n=1 Tax=Chrysodeixis includens TaxID=689277 RepID=A0A9N8L0M7_CHRIL|nr:unnamed protein product [Chrysodeixis includens]
MPNLFRLRGVLLSSENYTDESVDLTLVKQCESPPPVKTTHCEQSTQTDSPHAPYDCNVTAQIKEEPNVQLSPVKKEEENHYSIESDHFDGQSSDSEDVSLINLKKKKSKKAGVNGVTTEKRGKKKKSDMKDWEVLMKSLPEATLSLVSKEQVTDTLGTIKEELDEPSLLQEMDAFHCCVCFITCYQRSDMLKHYRQHATEAPGEAPPEPPPPAAEPLRCSRCQKRVSRAEWGRHWAQHWARDRRPYRCALCEKTFRDPRQILKHAATHNFNEGVSTEPVNKRFVCDHCPEGFVYMRSVLPC